MIIVKETSTTTFLKGQIVDENIEFTLVELSRVSGASEEELTLWVSEGVFEPTGEQPQEWRFSGAALRRVQTAQRLAHDFQINAPGVALALDLLDEIDLLRSRIKRPR
ncbi:merR HTH regulatory family protein [Paraburkholderia xenovorans LB400]|uniref:Transcriptional regulator, MerR family n=1 Tax=Paraburkholderia xenovorans (strain LB400) TaxID=266265 RepID=Q13QJ4_PARXL|nr:transcriptional regulator, MerR family [Paraburkholderia xenovorans LB400]AIP36226.1 merR HTH regulatory family protein [Paraburkholderia xenovorans LB400]